MCALSSQIWQLDISSSCHQGALLCEHIKNMYVVACVFHCIELFTSAEILRRSEFLNVWPYHKNVLSTTRYSDQHGCWWDTNIVFSSAVRTVNNVYVHAVAASSHLGLWRRIRQPTSSPFSRAPACEKLKEQRPTFQQSVVI